MGFGFGVKTKGRRKEHNLDEIAELIRSFECGKHGRDQPKRKDHEARTVEDESEAKHSFRLLSTVTNGNCD